MANSVDPDQTPHSAASDFSLLCLQSLSVPVLTLLHVITVYVFFFVFFVVFFFVVF